LLLALLLLGPHTHSLLLLLLLSLLVPLLHQQIPAC
jgi:hypothetical protein